MKYSITFLLIFSMFTLEAQIVSQSQKIVPENREPNDEFGNAVSISGDYAIVGAMREDEDGNDTNTAADAGSAYIFKRSNDVWTQEAKIVAADRESQDRFGHAVSISGTYCIVGAEFSGVTANTGAAYIYERNGAGVWVQVKKLEAPVQKANDYFGFSVAISGDYAVVGAYFEDEDENETTEVLSAGSAYVYKRNNANNTWEFYQKIVASDRSVDDRFGMSVGISGDRLIVGAEFDNVDGGNGPQSNAGSAYIFEIDGGVWKEKSHLTAFDYGQSENFGWSVAISQDYAIVGAYRNDTDSAGTNSSPDAGAAYIFERGSGAWPQVKKLAASDRRNIDYFGYSVAISDETAVVGAYRQNYDAEGNVMLSDAGAAYIFKRGTGDEWLEVQKITQTERKTLDNFGFAVGIDGDEVLVGSITEDEDENDNNPLPDAGAAYFFKTLSNSLTDFESKNIRIYPNPVTDKLNVTLPNNGTYRLRIIDIHGREIINRKLSNENNEVEVQNLVKGLYFIELLSEKGFLKTSQLLIN